MRVALVYMNNDKLISRGVGYLAMAIADAGHDLDFYDTVWMPDAEVGQAVAAGGYDVLLISSTSLYYRRAANLAAAIKQCLPGMTVVFGGIHATIARGAILADCPAIDYLCIGEGEDFIVEFLGRVAACEDVSSVCNLVYRAPNGTIVENPIRTCTDLHALKPFRHALFNPKSVVRDGELVPGFTYVFATRGCPYNCSYCCNSYMLALYKGSFLRTQKVDTVIAELLDLKARYPAKLLYFGDEMILFDEAYVTELFTRVHDEVRMPYGCMCRVERITPSIVTLMRETGCKYVGMGIECGDEAFRKEWLNRHMTNQQIIDAFAALRFIPDIWLTSYNMRGFPVSYDDRLTRATQDLNGIVKPNWVQTTWFCPLQGTRLGDYCIEKGLVDSEKLASVNDYFAQSVLRKGVFA